MIPCNNEEDGISNLHRQLSAVWGRLEELYDVELVFVDDGSTDGTVENISTQFADYKSISIEQHVVNQNLGAALRTGFASTTGDFICVLDSDCTYPPELIEPMMELALAGADVVATSAWHPDGGTETQIPFYRTFMSRVLSRSYRFILNCDNYTFTGMVRIYRREVVEQVAIQHDGFVAVAQLMIHAILRGFKVVDYPAVALKREYGDSKMKLIPVISAQLKLLISVLPAVFRKRVLGRNPF